MQTNYKKKNAKLSIVQGREIRRRAGGGEYAQDLAAEFGVNTCTIYDIIRYRLHASRVTAVLPDDVAIKLEAAAQSSGISVEEHAARVLARSVTK